jgi:hypothetical protein
MPDFELAAPSAAPPPPVSIVSDRMPVARVVAFDDPPLVTAGGEVCQLIELRQARLPEWPPSAVRADAASEALWESGERLAARFDRAISTTELHVPAPMQSNALGGVVTDGRLFRLHFLLFDELWPTEPGQAQAEVVFEIDPELGPTRSWIVKR